MNNVNHCIGKLCPACRYNKASMAYMRLQVNGQRIFGLM
jgi:hypothetical protein